MFLIGGGFILKAVVTGASSGIGRDIAINLVSRGYKVYAVARRSQRLEELKKEIGDNIVPLVYDISKEEDCFTLYNEIKDENIDILVNNAGLGVFGFFSDTDLEKELTMIDTNIRAVHVLTKLFLKDFLKRNNGCILNVASSAGYMMGPLLAGYYATKAYVLRLSQAINREIKEEGYNVRVSVLCPGPVKTEFDSVASVKKSLKGLSSKYVADYAIAKLLKGKGVIIPGITMKFSVFFSSLIPDRILSKITYLCQKKKQ